MQVMVTGAGGFVGTHVVRQLAADGHQVIAVARGPDALKRVSAELPAVTSAVLDLGDAKAVRDLLRQATPDGLIHLAWHADPEDYLTSHANLASLAMTVTVVEAVLAAGCRKLVLSGSCAEYAAKDRALCETDPAEARTLYAASKQSAWRIARVLADEADAELAWARMFHIHGPGEDDRRLIPSVARRIKAGIRVPLTEGNQVRDHLHVADVAAGLVALLAPGVTGIYNICSGQPVTLRQVLETVGDILGGRHLLDFGARSHRPDESMSLLGDARRLQALGWKPRLGLRAGLADALSASP